MSIVAHIFKASLTEGGFGRADEGIGPYEILPMVRAFTVRRGTWAPPYEVTSTERAG